MRGGLKAPSVPCLMAIATCGDNTQAEGSASDTSGRTNPEAISLAALLCQHMWFADTWAFLSQRGKREVSIDGWAFGGISHGLWSGEKL